MKKTLILILLSGFWGQKDVFAAIQPISEHTVTLRAAKPHLSFKEQVFAYFLQRKIQRLSTKQMPFFASKDSSGRECVHILLKQGHTISATIVRTDDKNITYQLCNQENAAEGTLEIERVASITDAQNRIIFKNQPKVVLASEPNIGDKTASASIWVLLLGLLAGVLTIFFGVLAIVDSLGRNNTGSNETLTVTFGILFLLSIVSSLVLGIVSLVQQAKIPSQKLSSKIWAMLSTIISGIIILWLLLLRLRSV
jgi:hypothetical protein